MDVQKKIQFDLLIFTVILYIYLCFITAWVSDDAMITFRVADHFIHGYGPVWNISERVQVYTHPLWFLLLSICSFVTREIYYTSLILSIGLSCAVFYLLISKIAVSRVAALFSVTLLCVSKSYIDYSTSGLENPLSHFLVVLFLYLYFQKNCTARRQWLLFTIAGFALVNRLDLLFFFAVPVLYLIYQDWGWRAAMRCVAGLLPLLVWELFSVIYYGFPYPNTAYAKVFNTSLATFEMFKMGIRYFVNSLWLDPVTLITIIFTLLLSLYRWNTKRGMITLGIAGYLVYVVCIGGDFMSGRFFSVPFLASVILLSRYSIPSEAYKWIIIWVGIWGVGFLSPDPVLHSSTQYATGKDFLIGEDGIANERAFYYQKLGLLADGRNSFAGYREYMVRDMPVQVVFKIGLVGYLVKPDVYLVDLYALSDPLLARLPALKPLDGMRFRIGHMIHYLPEGYIASIQQGSNQLQDKNLSVFYDKLCVITKGNIWSWERFKEIWLMNQGSYINLINQSFYSDPPKKVIVYDEASHSIEPYREWFDPRNYLFSIRGMEILFNQRCYSSSVGLSLEPSGTYDVVILDGTDELKVQRIYKDDLFKSAMRTINIEIPAELAGKGYTSVLIKPLEYHIPHSLGHVFIQ